MAGPDRKGISRDDLVVALVSIAGMSMIFAPFVLSITMWLLPAVALFAWPPGHSPWPPKLSERARDFRTLARRHRSILALTLLFLIVLLSAWQTTDWPYWWERLRIRIPFLILPLTAVLLPPLPRRRMDQVLVVLLLAMSLVCIGVGVNYLFHMEAIQTGLLRGKPIPVPRNHIRFSLLLALVSLGGLFLIWKSNPGRHPMRFAGLLAATVFTTFMLHFLTVRTGILVYYSGLFTLGIRHALRTRRVWVPVAMMAMAGILLWTGYHTLPSLRSRLDYMRWDLAMFHKGEGGLYADSGRLASLETGWAIFREHPVLGVGAGNLRREVNARFLDHYPDFVEPLTPHNQFLYVMAGTGLLGLLLFLIGFYAPFFRPPSGTTAMLPAFYGMATMALILEHTIENAVGAGFIGIFLLLFLTVRDSKPSTPKPAS